MTATHKNFLKTTISAVASSGLGAFTISTAVSGYRTFGAGDDGLTFDGVTITEGTDWEVRDGCVYTHSGTSLSRGTLQDSSTGSAIAFTSAAVVSQSPSAGLAGRIEQAALIRATGGDSSITLAPNTHYTWDLSTLTADRTGTLPTTAAVGDAIEISATTSNASYELLLSTGSGQTCALGGTVVAASTEITRLLMAGESMRFVYEASNKWVAEDGRIPASAVIFLSTDADGEGLATWTLPTSAGGAWSTSVNNGMTIDLSTGKITARRTGKFDVLASARSKDSLIDQKYYIVAAYVNGVSIGQMTNIAPASQVIACSLAFPNYPITQGSYAQIYYQSESGGVGMRGPNNYLSYLSLKELL